MTTGVVPANSYRVLLDPNGEIVWETPLGLNENLPDGKQLAFIRRGRDELERGRDWRDGVRFAAHDQTHLGVGLVVDEAVNHGSAGALQHLRQNRGSDATGLEGSAFARGLHKIGDGDVLRCHRRWHLWSSHPDYSVRLAKNPAAGHRGGRGRQHDLSPFSLGRTGRQDR